MSTKRAEVIPVNGQMFQVFDGIQSEVCGIWALAGLAPGTHPVPELIESRIQISPPGLLDPTTHTLPACLPAHVHNIVRSDLARCRPISAAACICIPATPLIIMIEIE